MSPVWTFRFLVPRKIKRCAVPYSCFRCVCTCVLPVYCVKLECAEQTSDRRYLAVSVSHFILHYHVLYIHYASTFSRTLLRFCIIFAMNIFSEFCVEQKKKREKLLSQSSRYSSYQHVVNFFTLCCSPLDIVLSFLLPPYSGTA
jgi:hypothetical protein